MEFACGEALYAHDGLSVPGGLVAAAGAIE